MYFVQRVCSSDFRLISVHFYLYVICMYILSLDKTHTILKVRNSHSHDPDANKRLDLCNLVVAVCPLDMFSCLLGLQFGLIIKSPFVDH